MQINYDFNNGFYFGSFAHEKANQYQTIGAFLTFCECDDFAYLQTTDPKDLQIFLDWIEDKGYSVNTNIGTI